MDSVIGWIVQNDLRKFSMQEFDRGGYVFRLAAGTLSRTEWSGVYYPLPHSLWNHLGLRQRLYLVLSKIIVRGAQPYYTFPGVPAALAGKWRAMEREQLKGLVNYDPFVAREILELGEAVDNASVKEFALAHPKPRVAAVPREPQQLVNAAQVERLREGLRAMRELQQREAPAPLPTEGQIHFTAPRNVPTWAQAQQPEAPPAPPWARMATDPLGQALGQAQQAAVRPVDDLWNWEATNGR
jgi:hypothetical protein